jgi:hypothetical protein
MSAMIANGGKAHMTGEAVSVAIDPERPSTASGLIKLMRRTYHRTIH